MTKAVTNRIYKLLDALKSDFPRRKRAAEKLMRQMGLSESLSLNISSPELVTSIPTFRNGMCYAATPMLKARFEYAGSWEMGQDLWLPVDEMVSHMRSKEIRSYHRALRDNWCESAPMLYSDKQLTLYGITHGVPDSLTYLVWAKEGDEPEVWTYAGFQSHQSENLEHFLQWCHERK